MRAQIRAQSGASGTQKAQPPRPDKVTAKIGATDATKRQTKMGNLTAQVRKSTTQQSGEGRSNHSVWKVKCLEKSERNACPHKGE